ncbi:MAG: hypothetical protein DRQ89_15575 [Epsilonproteobacteria bacterium]|nr:MAG: hypothetical protein DRQ89_15575 [Campylobacterota bacterium]
MGAKVTFDAVTRIIQVTQVPVLENGDWVIDIDVQIDLYSDGKEDWVADETLRKLQFPIRAVGGDPLPGSKVLGDTYFIRSDWKIAPYEASHRLRVNGNFYSEDGTSPFNTTLGSYNIFLEQTVSSLVDSTVAQLSEIEHGTYNGGVTVDLLEIYSGTDYPTGTSRQPVNNLTDAITICLERGFGTFYILGDATLDTAIDFTSMVFVGESQTKTKITIDPAAIVANAEFYDAEITGTLDGNAKIKGCEITSLNYINGFVEQCVLSPGIILLGGGAAAHFLDCWSGVPGLGTPVIDMGGSGQSLALRNYNGGISLRSKSGPESVSLDINSGTVILENTVTAGIIVARGVGKMVDENGEHIRSGTWNGATIVNELVNPQAVAEASRDLLLGTTSYP